VTCKLRHITLSLQLNVQDSRKFTRWALKAERPYPNTDDKYPPDMCHLAWSDCPAYICGSPQFMEVFVMRLPASYCYFLLLWFKYFLRKKLQTPINAQRVFFVNYNTLLHVSTLHSALCTVHCTVNSTFSLNCIVQPSVTTTESFSLKMTQQGRNM
jgi:hypothetical protein